MGKGFPDLKEFSEIIKKNYEAMLSAFSREQTDRYWNCDECQEVLKTMYEDCLEALKNRKSGEEKFQSICINSVSSSLSTLFELMFQPINKRL